MNEEGKKRNYDYTSTQRAQRRAQQLHAVAQEQGFDTWYKLETAVINGAIITVLTMPVCSLATDESV